MIALKLACGHPVKTDVVPMLQYTDDTNYVWCPTCRELKDSRIPLDWCEIVGALSYVPSGAPVVMPRDFIRVQPRLRGKPNRQRPLPYVRGLLGTSGRGRG